MALASLVISVMTFLFGSGLIYNLSKTVKGINTLKMGMQSMLRDRLLQAHRHYKGVGKISYMEMQNLLYMYEMYHELGANGVMNEVIEEIKSIPIEG